MTGSRCGSNGERRPPTVPHVAAEEDLQVSAANSNPVSRHHQEFVSRNNSMLHWSENYSYHDTVVYDTVSNTHATSLLSNTENFFKSFLRSSDSSFIDVMRNSYLSVASRISQRAIHVKNSQRPNVTAASLDTEALIAAPSEAVEASEAHFIEHQTCIEPPNDVLCPADKNLISEICDRETTSDLVGAGKCCLNDCAQKLVDCCDTNSALCTLPAELSVTSLDDAVATSLDDGLATLPDDALVTLPDDASVTLLDDASIALPDDALATLPDDVSDVSMTLPCNSSATIAEDEVACCFESPEYTHNSRCTSSTSAAVYSVAECITPFPPLPDLVHESSLVDSCLVAQAKFIPVCDGHDDTADFKTVTSSLAACSKEEFNLRKLHEVLNEPYFKDSPLGLNEILFTEKPVCRRSSINRLSPFSIISCYDGCIPIETTLSNRRCSLDNEITCSRSCSLEPLVSAEETDSKDLINGHRSPSTVQSNFIGSSCLNSEELPNHNEGNFSSTEIGNVKQPLSEDIRDIPMNHLKEIDVESLCEPLNRDVSSQTSDETKKRGINSLSELLAFIVENNGLLESIDFDVKVREDLLKSLIRVGCEESHDASNLISDEATTSALNSNSASVFSLAGFKSMDKTVLTSNSNAADQPKKILEGAQSCEIMHSWASCKAVQSHVIESKDGNIVSNETNQYSDSINAEQTCKSQVPDALTTLDENCGAACCGLIAASRSGSTDVPAVCSDLGVCKFWDLCLFEMERQLRDRKTSFESERFRSDFFHKTLPFLRHLSLEGVSLTDLCESFKLYPSVCEPASLDVIMELGNVSSKEGNTGSITQLLSFRRSSIETENFEVGGSVSSSSSNRNIPKIIFIKNLLSLLALICQDHVKNTSENEPPRRETSGQASLSFSATPDVSSSENGSHEDRGLAAETDSPSHFFVESRKICPIKSLETVDDALNSGTSASLQSCVEVSLEEKGESTSTDASPSSSHREQEIQNRLKLSESSHKDILCSKATSPACTAVISAADDVDKNNSHNPGTDKSPVTTASSSRKPSPVKAAVTSSVEVVPVLSQEVVPVKYVQLSMSIVLALVVHAVQSLSALMLELFLDTHRDGHHPY
ncbi:hypothetical protein FHG87_002968 [Trinorchestia longiramus]|nr:hypothetical protein FHG87_002968 [Trinorchestia longiramus]